MVGTGEHVNIKGYFTMTTTPWILAYCSDPVAVGNSSNEPMCFTYTDSSWVNIRESTRPGFCFTNQETIDRTPFAFEFIGDAITTNPTAPDRFQFRPVSITITLTAHQIVLESTETECNVGTATWQDGYNVNTNGTPELSSSFELRDIETDEGGISTGAVWYTFGTIAANTIALKTTLTSVESKLRPVTHIERFTIAYKNESPVLKTTQFSINYLGNEQLIDIDITNNPHGYEIDWKMDAVDNITLSPAQLTVAGGTPAGTYSIPITITNRGFDGRFEKETRATIGINIVYNTTPLHIFNVEHPEYIHGPSDTSDTPDTSDFTLFSTICVSSFSSSTVYTFADMDSTSYRLVWNPDLRETLVLMSSTDEILATTRQKLRLHEPYWLTVDLTDDHISIHLNDVQTPQYSAPIEVLNHPLNSGISAIRAHLHDPTPISTPTLYRIKPLTEKCMYQNREAFKAPMGFTHTQCDLDINNGTELDGVADHRYNLTMDSNNPMTTLSKKGMVEFYIVTDENVWTGRAVMPQRHGGYHHNITIDKIYFSTKSIYFTNVSVYFGPYDHRVEKSFLPEHYPQLYASVVDNDFISEITSDSNFGFVSNQTEFRFLSQDDNYLDRIGPQCKSNFDELTTRVRRRGPGGAILDQQGNEISPAANHYFDCWILLSNNHVIALTANVARHSPPNKSLGVYCTKADDSQYIFADYLKVAIMYYGPIKNVRLPDNIKMNYRHSDLTTYGSKFSIHSVVPEMIQHDFRGYLTLLRAFNENTEEYPNERKMVICTVKQNGTETTAPLTSCSSSSDHFHLFFDSDVDPSIANTLRLFYDNFKGLSVDCYTFYFKNIEFFLYHYTGTSDAMIPDIEPTTIRDTIPFPTENAPLHYSHFHDSYRPLDTLPVTESTPIYAIPVGSWDDGSTIPGSEFTGATVFNPRSTATIDARIYKLENAIDVYTWIKPEPTEIWIETSDP